MHRLLAATVVFDKPQNDKKVKEIHMPNWVYNRIVFEGSISDLEKISETLTAKDAPDPLSFNNLIPRPADKDDDAYNWNIANWGTKWDACHGEHELKNSDSTPASGKLCYAFDTAWAPPAPVIDVMIEKFRHVKMSYTYEEEQGWGGALSAQGGEITEQSQYDMPNSHQEMVERNGNCWCEHGESDSQVFDDCYGARAAQRDDVTREAKETAKSLSPGWHGTFEELLQTSKAL